MWNRSPCSGFNDLPDCTVPPQAASAREAVGRHATEQLLALIADKEVRDRAGHGVRA